MYFHGPDEMVTLDTVADAIASDGYLFLAGDTLKVMIEESGTIADWPAFSASWDDLELDPYLGGRGRFRKRRYAVYDVTDHTVIRQPHQPHHQRIEYNPLFGGIERWFAPVETAIGDGPTMTGVLRFCRTVFGSLDPAVRRWHVEVHQFRIEARDGEQGQPTPEGVHRDGVDFVLVLLVARRNILSGTTTVHGENGRQLGSFTLTDPFDAALLDDARVAHGVTPVTPLDASRPAYRDVLVVTFRR
jgi:hypothetical protein